MHCIILACHDNIHKTFGIVILLEHKSFRPGAEEQIIIEMKHGSCAV